MADLVEVVVEEEVTLQEVLQEVVVILQEVLREVEVVILQVEVVVDRVIRVESFQLPSRLDTRLSLEMSPRLDPFSQVSFVDHIFVENNLLT